MVRSSSVLSFLALSMLELVSANPIRHIYENFQTEPADFIINSVIVAFLLCIGGILAGTILFLIIKMMTHY